MNPRTCFATADTPRAILALVAPLLAVTIGIVVFGNKGDGLTEYLRLLQSGELSWFGQGVGWLALLFWVARYFPPAWSALWNGPCLVSGDKENLYLSNGKQIPLANIQSVRVQRDLFRKIALIETTEGRVSVSLLFVRPSSDTFLRSVPTAGALAA